VSVVVAVYSGEKYLAAAIRSVLGRTYRDLELVVVDGGSADRSLDIIDSFTRP
jgi:glycosyltransferase involved in cell wall biosynthesis